MGAGASSKQLSTTPAVFFSSGVVACGCRLRNDELLSLSFLDYVKGGGWLDRLDRFVSKEDEPLMDEDRFSCCSPERILTRYGLDDDTVLRLVNFENKSPSGKFRSRTTSTDSVYSCRELENALCIRKEELCFVLLRVVFPLYLESSSYRSFVEHGHHSHPFCTDDENSIETSDPDPSLIKTIASVHAKEVLYECAAHIDGDELLSIIRQDWIQSCASVITGHTLSICVVDATAPDYPFVYMNDAFCAQFEFGAWELLGRSLSVLRGTGTAYDHFDSLFHACKTNTHTKTWVTLYTKHKRAVLDLVAVETVGPYAVMVHFPVVPGKSDFAQLGMVDELLLLLTYLVVVPPANTTVVQPSNAT